MCDDDATETVHMQYHNYTVVHDYDGRYLEKIQHSCNNIVTSLHATKVEISSSYYHNSNFHAPLPADSLLRTNFELVTLRTSLSF